MALKLNVQDAFLLLAAALVAPSPARASPPAPHAAGTGCAPAPTFDAGALRRHKKAAARILKNFNTAYRQACFKGVLRNRPLIRSGSVPPGRLFLKNAPDANVASIYNEGGEGERPGRMVLEYPFLAGDGSVNVPGADELEEAIFCAVQGASAAEQEEEGRCLPD